MNNLFSSLQFGFCKGLGICDALLTITNVVQKELDSGCKVRKDGFYFGAPFDHVNHDALISKLMQLGLGGVFLRILTEFLTDLSAKGGCCHHFSAW